MKKYVKLLIPLTLIAAVYIIFHVVGIGCPIKFVTAIGSKITNIIKIDTEQFVLY